MTRIALALPLAVLLFGASACGGEAGVTDEDFADLDSTVTELEERVGVLEEKARN